MTALCCCRCSGSLLDSLTNISRSDSTDVWCSLSLFLSCSLTHSFSPSSSLFSVKMLWIMTILFVCDAGFSIFELFCCCRLCEREKLSAYYVAVRDFDLKIGLIASNFSIWWHFNITTAPTNRNTQSNSSHRIQKKTSECEKKMKREHRLSFARILLLWMCNGTWFYCRNKKYTTFSRDSFWNFSMMMTLNDYIWLTFRPFILFSLSRSNVKLLSDATWQCSQRFATIDANTFLSIDTHGTNKHSK